jgi:hypothetical protein
MAFAARGEQPNDRVSGKLPLSSSSARFARYACGSHRMQLLDLQAHCGTMALLLSRSRDRNGRRHCVSARRSRTRFVALCHLRMHNPLDADRPDLLTRGYKPQDVRPGALARTATSAGRWRQLLRSVLLRIGRRQSRCRKGWPRTVVRAMNEWSKLGSEGGSLNGRVWVFGFPRWWPKCRYCHSCARRRLPRRSPL